MKQLTVGKCGFSVLPISLYIFSFCSPTNTQAQFMRQVVIFQGKIKEFTVDQDPNIPYGVDIRLWDSTGKTRVELIQTIKDNDLHGNTYLFNTIAGLP